MSDSLRMEPGSKYLPDWVPGSVLLYLDHTEKGLSMRRLARRSGCHASTVMRQIRKLENRRDDRLVDEALKRLRGQYVGEVRAGFPQRETQKERQMNVPKSSPSKLPDEARLNREALRILTRLCEDTAVLAVAADLEKAVVVREKETGGNARTAVVDRGIAEAMALNNWIDCVEPGKVSRYHITAEGRAALSRLLAGGDNRAPAGFAEASAVFKTAPDDCGGTVPVSGRAPLRRSRYNAAESPMLLLARRKDRNGKPFLSPDLVAAGERLHEDFELARMETPVVPNWDRELSETEPDGAATKGPEGATACERVARALRDLGPGLGDVALRCCCYFEGLETAEKRMGWSARSGKIVLRIALQRLKKHYDNLGDTAAMIG